MSDISTSAGIIGLLSDKSSLGKGTLQIWGDNLKRPYGAHKKMIFRAGASPRREKSLKERHLHDSRLTFSSKLKRTPWE